MSTPQAGILLPLPPLARYLAFSLAPDSDVGAGLAALLGVVDGVRTVAGIGLPPLTALGKKVAGLKPFPPLSGPGVELPSTPFALWLWLRGDDRGELLHRARRIEQALAQSSERLAHVRERSDLQVRLSELTERERDVMDLVVAGLPNKLIADQLDISVRTVEVHRSRVFDKMQVKSAVELANLLRAGQ